MSMLAHAYMLDRDPNNLHKLAVLLFRGLNRQMIRKSVSALVDHCAMRVADAARTETYKVHFSSRGSTGWYLEDRPKFTEISQWKREQLASFPSVSLVSAAGRLKLFTYQEISWEEFRGSGFSAWNLLSTCQIQRLDSPIERSHFRQSIDLDRQSSKPALEDFIKDILARDVASVQKMLDIVGSYRGIEFKGGHHLETFRSIFRNAPKNHYADLFHIWTSCVHGLDYFLTVDKKLIHYVYNTAKLNIPCRVVSPAQLLGLLGICRPWPLPRSARQFRFHRNCVLTVRQNASTQVIAG